VARRPKRSLVEELDIHRSIAIAAHTTCAALEGLHPDVSEFVVARKMLDDACKELDRRIADQIATPQPVAEAGA
jgi:hypothetical protein